MKPIFMALVFIALASPATSQGNSPHSGSYAPSAPAAAPLSELAQQASNACLGLIERTESAVANGHVQQYDLYDCQCLSESIDFPTWSESSGLYDGPAMSQNDAYTIINAVQYSPTIEDAFSEVESRLSQDGFSAITACYPK